MNKPKFSIGEKVVVLASPQDGWDKEEYGEIISINGDWYKVQVEPDGAEDDGIRESTAEGLRMAERRSA